MPFTLIKGSFRVLGKTKTGKATGFEPDGDSMQFRPDRLALLDRLEQIMSPYRPTAIGSTQLRFEGIDALELHFAAKKYGMTHQPRPLADEGRDHLVTKAGLDPVGYKPPQNIRVQPPAPRDGARGYILSRSLEVHGRPVSFVFVGEAPDKDGATIRLDAALLRQSLNYEMLAAGEAYPLFYDTLFYDLRDTLADAARDARSKGRGLWPADRTQVGAKTGSIPELEANAVIFPKLFRRLAEYFGSGAKKLDKFPAWVAAKEERVLDLDTTNNTHFDSYIAVNNGSATLTKAPERLVFVSAKGKAPWM